MKRMERARGAQKMTRFESGVIGPPEKKVQQKGREGGFGNVEETLGWLLGGDAAVRWQALQDLAGVKGRELQAEMAGVARTGWGRRILELQGEDGVWGGGLYTPKWTSSTYTLLLLKAFGVDGKEAGARKGALVLLDAGVYRDGGINFWHPQWKCSETCVTGMGLAIAGRFAGGDERKDKLAEHLLGQQMTDGGWNCRRPRGATHSSMHTTISVLEGLLEYEGAGGRMARETRAARMRAHEFLYRHRMFRSHRTGIVIDDRMTRFSFPPQWHYDVLRGLDYLRAAGAERDERLTEAIELVERRRGADGRWPLQNVYKGKYHFGMERPGAPSRWNTLRALRVLRWWYGKRV